MADDIVPLNPKKTNGGMPADAADISSLYLDPALGDGLVDVHYHNIPVGKPRDFFRVNPDPLYRRLCEIYTHKVEGQVEDQHYVIARSMQGVIEEGAPLHACHRYLSRWLAAAVAAEATEGRRAR